MKKRFAALVVALVLAVGLMPAIALAYDGGLTAASPALEAQASGTYGSLEVVDGPTFLGPKCEVVLKAKASMFIYGSNNAIVFRVYKGDTLIDENTQVYSQSGWGEKEWTFKATACGTYTAKAYLVISDGGAEIATETFEVIDGALHVKDIKPKVSVARTGAKKAKVTCSNSEGYGMQVFRAPKKGGAYKLIATTTKSAYADKKITADKAYFYKVRLFAKSGKKTYLSKWSAVAKAPSVKTIKPEVIVTRTAQKSAEIACENRSGLSMQVFRAPKKSGTYKLIVTTAKSTYVDKTIAANKAYYYKVRLSAKSGKKTLLSKFSAVAQAAKYVDGDITLSYSSSKGVKVSWKAMKGAGYYLLFRSVGNDDEYKEVACVGSETTTYFDKDVQKGKTYYYAVIAEKNDAEFVGKYLDPKYKIKAAS